MLERLIRRRRNKRRRVFLAGFAVFLFSCNYAFAQFSSPAVFGVYNTANQFGSGGYGAASGGQFASPADGMGVDMGMGANSSFGYGLNGRNFTSFLTNEPTTIDGPEYVYRGHDEKQPVLSTRFYMYYQPKTKEVKYAVLSGSGDTTAKLWDLDGKYDPETTEWFVTGTRIRKTYKDVHKQGVTKAIFSPDFKYVLTSSYDAAGRLWTLDGAENIRAYVGAKDRLWSIDVAPSGEYVGAACNDGRVYFWEAMGTAKKLGYLPNRQDAEAETPDSTVGHDGPVFDLAFDPTSQFVATAGADGSVRLWNLSLMKQVAIFQGHKDKVFSVVFSADGNYLLTASRDKTARLWDPRTGREICRFVGHTGAVRQAIFAGSFIATASDDGTVRFWQQSYFANSNAPNNNNNNMSRGASMGATYPGGASELGPGSDPNGRNQEEAKKPQREPGRPKGTQVYVFETGGREPVPVFSLDVSQDSVYLCGGCADGAVRIWKIPGRARYYGDYSQTGSDSGYGLGDNPLADPSAVMPVGEPSGLDPSLGGVSPEK